MEREKERFSEHSRKLSKRQIILSISHEEKNFKVPWQQFYAQEKSKVSFEIRFESECCFYGDLAEFCIPRQERSAAVRRKRGNYNPSVDDRLLFQTSYLICTRSYSDSSCQH